MEMHKQRPSKKPINLEEKLKKLPTQLEDADNIRQRGHDDEIGSRFVNPITLMPQSGYVKLVIDAQVLNFSRTSLTTRVI